MKKPAVILLLGAVAVGALLSGCSKAKNPAAAGATAEMKIKWTVGKKYSMRVELNQTTETKLPNRTEPMKQTVKFTEDYNMAGLKELDNGGRQLELEFEDSTMDVDQNGRKVLSFDSTQSSAQDSNNPVAPVLRKMVGARVQYVTDANGAVTEVQGADDLIKRLGENAKPQEKAMFQQMFGGEILKQYGSFGDMMPNKPVSVGDSWTVNRQIVSPVGIMKVDMKYTFKGWEQHGDRKCAHIEDTGEISSKKDSTNPNGSFEIEKGEISGDVWFDPELGMIVDSSSDQDMTMKVVTRGQTMEPKMNQKLNFTLVDTEQKP